MSTATFPQKNFHSPKKSASTLTLSAGIAQLRSIHVVSRLKDFILDHEGWALVVLAISLIAGTVFYVDFGSHP